MPYLNDREESSKLLLRRTGGRVVMALRLGLNVELLFSLITFRSSKERGFESHPVHYQFLLVLVVFGDGLRDAF